MKRIILVVFGLLMLCPQAYAVPIFYSLHGTVEVPDPDPFSSVWLFDEISGIMVVDSEPEYLVYPADADSYFQIHWNVESLTINSDIFNYYGSGYYNFTGTPNSIVVYNEAYISGYGYTPYYQGAIYNVTWGPNFFYNEDGSPIEVTYENYSSELPYMIAPGSSPTAPIEQRNWAFSSNENTPYLEPLVAIIRNFNATRIASPAPVAPVPEPSTMLLLGTGLIGFFGLGRKRFKKYAKNKKPR